MAIALRPQSRLTLAFLFLAWVGVLLAGPTPAGAVTYETTNLTNNLRYDYEPEVNSAGQVVWSGYDGSDYEIFLWDHGFTTQITNNTWDDVLPRISSTGDIAWSGYDGHDWEIWLRRGGVNAQITNNDFDDGHSQYTEVGETRYYGVRFDYKAVVWAGGTAGNKEIYMYNYYTEPANLFTLSNLAGDDDFPHIAGPNVAYQHYDGHDWEIYLWVGSPTGSTNIQVTNNANTDRRRRVNEGGDVVWEGWDGTDYEIYYFNPNLGMTTPVALTNNSVDDSYPWVSDERLVVWYASDGHDTEIYLRDLNNLGAPATQLTNNAYDDDHPIINNNGQVAYRGWDGHDWEIYVYSNGIVPVTQNEVDEGWFLSFSRYGQGQVVGESKTAGGTTEIILGNPTYFFYDTCTLRDGAVYTGFVLAKIDFTYYIGFLSGEATPSYQGFYLPYDWGTEGDDWTAYYFSYTIGGQTYIGLGKDYETGTDWGYCYGFNQATPADYFICAYQETAPSTYQYYYSYADGAMYLGQAYVNLPSGYYFGVLNGGSKYYLGVYYFLEGLTNGPGSGKGIFWSLVHGVNLLDHEYGD